LETSAAVDRSRLKILTCSFHSLNNRPQQLGNNCTGKNVA
jgi:hypothetical protein